MERVQVGMRVNRLDDARIGTVQSVKRCCVEVKCPDGTLAYVGPEGIFSVTYGTITLICDEGALQRYRCKLHPLITARSPAESFLG